MLVGQQLTDSCSGESSAVGRENSMIDNESVWNVSLFFWSFLICLFGVFLLCFPSEVIKEKKCSEHSG